MKRSLNVDDLSRLLQLILDIADEDQCTPAEAIERMALLLSPSARSMAPERSKVAALADSVRRMRMRRNELFGAPLFRDPAWDMLLELYVADECGRTVSVSSLCYASGVPPSTALRQVARLEQHGLIERRLDEEDDRRWFVQATPKALAAVETAAAMVLDRTHLFQAPAAAFQSADGGDQPPRQARSGGAR